MKHRTSLAIAVAVIGVASFLAPASADEGADPWWAPRLRSKKLAGGEGQGTPDDAPSVPAKPAAAPEPSKRPAASEEGVTPDSSLAKAMRQLREGPIGREPNAVAYLDLMDAGRASAAQVNDFAAYLAKRGMPAAALSFQEYALRIKRDDATLWLNLGTIRRTLGSLGSAESAFRRALEIDPNNALAHYNLGAVYDANKNYDAAIEEYRRALVLDPDLADARKNPQIVNNDNLLAVKLLIYQDQAGSLGLPLRQMQKNGEASKVAPEKP